MHIAPLARNLLVTALAFGTAAIANAVPVLRLTTNTGATTEITDGGAGDASPVAGAVVFLAPLDSNWLINVTTGLSKPLLGSSSIPELDLNSVNVSSQGGGWVDIELTDTDFTPQAEAAFLAAIGGTTSVTGSVSYKTYFDTTNTKFGKEHELTSIVGLGPAFSGTATSLLSSTLPYSLTLLVRITHTAPQVSSFDATLKVPEPSILLLLGAGMLAFGAAGRRSGALARKA